jgi:LuxR family transcriptional regulator, maltose regulon positive regulatory protein
MSREMPVRQAPQAFKGMPQEISCIQKPAGLPANTNIEDTEVTAKARIAARAERLSERCEAVSRLSRTTYMPRAGVAHIRLGLRRAWGMALALRIDQARTILTAIERGLGRFLDPEATEIRVEVQIIRAVCFAIQDDILIAMSIAQSSLKEGLSQNLSDIGFVVTRLGLWRMGNLDSYHALPWTQSETDSTRRSLSTVYGLAMDAAVAIDQLRFNVAERLSLNAMELADQIVEPCSDAAILPAILLGQILYERGQLREASQIVRERISTVKSVGTIETATRAYVVLVRIAIYRADFDHASLLLQDAETLSLRRKWPRMTAAILAERQLMYLSQDRIEEAVACTERLERMADKHLISAGCNLSDIHHHSQVARTKLGIALGPSLENVATLTELHRNAVTRQNLYLALQLSIELAEVFLALKKTTESAEVFRGVMSVAANVGIFQSFFDRSPKVKILLSRFYDDGQTMKELHDLLPYAGSLLTKARSRYLDAPIAKSAIRSAESLTAREISILRLIADGFATKRIAQTLGIMPETVKSHVKNIFAKLAVKKRAEAVYRAKSLGLMGEGS